MNDWLKTRAKEMRKNPALYERRLWRLLRDRRLECLKFRRQVVIGRYIADFVCLRHRLIIEADGPSHEEGADHDAVRDSWLSDQGFLVLRFPNSQVESRSWEVVDAIITASKRKLAKD